MELYIGKNITPFHCFRTSTNYYIYFASTNQFFSVKKVFFTRLKKIEKIFSKSEQIPANIDKNLSELKLIFPEIFDDFFKSFKVPFNLKKLKDKIEGNTKQFTIELTENCNLTCDYCVYNGKYLFRRLKSNKSFNKKIIQKTCDFIIFQSKNVRNPVIGFYGGEPLLEFELIEKFVNTIKSRCNKDFKFQITTNGTLLSKRIISWIVENQISLTISLDGPKNIHDKKRITCHKLGTFDTIFEKIKFLKNRYPDYYSSNISINAVLWSYKNLKVLNTFFSDKIFNDVNISLDNVSLNCGEEIFNMGSMHRFSNLRNNYINKKISGITPTKIETELFENSFIPKIHLRTTCKKSEYYHYPNGICIPALKKIFVTINGNLKICERVSKSINIGSIESGLNYDFISSLIKEYCSNIEPCNKCWAIRFCFLCFIHSYGKKYDKSIKLKHCFFLKNALDHDFKTYASIMSKNINAFKNLNNTIFN